MTTIISRLYKDQKTADAVAAGLAHEEFPAGTYDVIAAGDDTEARITAAGVAPASAAAYASNVDAGNALVVCRAPFTPFGAARVAMTVMDGKETLDAGVENENAYQGDLSTGGLPKIQDRRWADFLMPLLAPHKTFTRASTVRDGYYGGFLIAHLIPGHKFMAKFPFAHLVPGHKFMAKFPFAHLVPGHKYMAKFPFAHIVPGHKFYAKAPIDHLVPGHKYMANWIWPHTVSKGS
ncbi:MAG: hypothetical protein AAF409_14645 [Pseudomonadota bacterium]